MAEIFVNTQSSIRISEGGFHLYFDPWKLGDDAPKADFIFVTHDHFDHFSPEDIRKIAREGTVIVYPAAAEDKIRPKIDAEGVQFLSVFPGGTYEEDDITIEAVAAYNVLKPFHPKAKGYCGYVVTLDGVRYYVTGDTDANADNQTVSCDVLLLPIGGMYTMNVKDAVAFTCALQPEIVIPTHYGEVVGSPKDGENFVKLLAEKAPEIGAALRL